MLWRPSSGNAANFKFDLITCRFSMLPKPTGVRHVV